MATKYIWCHAYARCAIVMWFLIIPILIYLFRVAFPIFQRFPDEEYLYQLIIGEAIVKQQHFTFKMYDIVFGAVWRSLSLNELSFICLNVLFLSIFLINILKCLDFTRSGRYGRVILVFLLACYPALLIFTGSILRESLFLVGFSLFVKMIIQYVYENKFSYFYFLLSVLIVYFSRAHFLLAFMAVVLAMYLTSPSTEALFSKIVGFIFILITIVIIAEYLGFGRLLTPSGLSFFVEGRLEGSGQPIRSQGNWDSIFGLIILLPSVLISFLFSPFVQNGFTSSIPYLMDSLYLGLVFGVTFFAIFTLKVKLNLNIIRILLCSFIVIALPAIFETNIGGAVRHRMPGIVIFLLFTSAFFGCILDRRRIL